ncbi:MAG TPA: hypothetical protein VJ242_00895 [Patescibacteria group bacterium]|nr:hypothetical protein [Patescibacteria group bacterium]
MSNGEKCFCTGGHFCPGVDRSVLEIIAHKSGQTIEETMNQSFSADQGGMGHVEQWINPTQITYRELLKSKALVLPSGFKHVEVAQPLGSETGPAHDSGLI